MKRKKLFLYYLDPRNVSASVEKYGYTYNVKNTILAYLIVILLSAAAGAVFKLGVPGV